MRRISPKSVAKIHHIASMMMEEAYPEMPVLNSCHVECVLEAMYSIIEMEDNEVRRNSGKNKRS